MSKSFAELFEESLTNTNMRAGAILKGTVEKIDERAGLVTVSCPYIKSDGVIAIEQFYDEKGELEVTVGEEVDVALDTFEDGFGETILSRERAKRAESWTRLNKAYQANETVMGVITGRVKGGFTVEIDHMRAFLPGSLVDIRPVRDPSYLEGKDLEFKIIKVDQKRSNIVVSRRAVVEAESSAEREELLETMEEGQEVKGIVKNLTDYGCFVDLGGIDGLLHITDMSWKRIKHPSELVNIGDEIKVKILKFDRDKNRVSLGLKQLGSDPWLDIVERYPVNSKLTGKVTNLTDYGCFVEIEEGVEGLVHVSEMDWTNKNINPKKVVHLGQEVEVIVLEIDAEKRRISLGIKQCKENPWLAFAELHQVNEHLTGKIKSITDFGIFIGLEGDIDGLVHLSDISWTVPGEQAIRQYKKAQEIETIILGIDAERERISLGIKQLEKNPLTDYLQDYPKGTEVTGTVKEVNQKRIILELADSVEGILPIADIPEPPQEGETLSSKVVGLDGKHNAILLTTQAVKESSSTERPGKNSANRGEEGVEKTTLGDLIKEKMQDKE